MGKDTGWAWPTNLTKWLVKRATSPQRRHFYKVGKRYLALSYTKAFGWSQKHFLVDPSFFFFPFFSQISSLHHVQLLFAYSWLKYYIYFHLKKLWVDYLVTWRDA